MQMSPISKQKDIASRLKSHIMYKFSKLLTLIVMASSVTQINTVITKVLSVISEHNPNTAIKLFSLLHRACCQVTQLLHQPLHIYKILHIKTPRHV